MRRVNDNERGAAAVEFALIFVMLLGLFFMLIEGGILFMHQAVVSASARDGARMWAITANEDEAESVAQGTYGWLGSLDSVSTSSTGTCELPPDRSVEVKVVVKATPTFSLGVFGNPQLTGEGTMRCGG